MDRACATLEWTKLFPHAKVINIQSTYLNHNPILLNLSQPNQNCRKKKIPTRFEEKWAYHLDCKGVVRGAWEAENVAGSLMFRFFTKIKRCRLELVQWSRNIFGNFKTKTQEKQSALEALSLHNDLENLLTIKTLKNDINTLLNQDELFWHQRSRSIWLPAGDKNIKFFHQRVNQRLRKNHISEITSQTEECCTSEDQIVETAKQYFQNLFITSNSTDYSGVLNSMDHLVTPTMNNTLLQRYSP